MPQLEIGSEGEITLTPELLDHIGLPSGGVVISKKLSDGSVVLQGRRKAAPSKPFTARLLTVEKAARRRKRK